MKNICKRKECLNYSLCISDHTRCLMNGCMSNSYHRYETIDIYDVAQREGDHRDRLNSQYEYTNDGFCNGFTK